MSHFLLVYDRAAGHLLREERFGSLAEALAVRFLAEADTAPDTEVVVLSAPSRDDLLRTHARYFLSFDELAARGVA
jgi:hypothetical protein